MHALICCDEQDSEVGHFVQLCADQTQASLDDIGIIIERLNSDDLTSARVNQLANQNGDQPFICAAYSHGNESALVNESLSTEYVSINVNLTSFRNVFFYTWACYAGVELAEALCKNGCAVFIGHITKVIVVGPGDPALQAFVNCATYGLDRFYHDNVTAVNSLRLMKDYCDTVQQELYESGDTYASILIQDFSNSIEIFGNEALTYDQLLQNHN